MSNKNQTLINDRYRIVKKLGIGGSATTYQAQDLETNKQVALKVLSLKQIDEWKKIELFIREAEILKQLNHSQIPDYLDYFEIDTDDDKSFYLVQELADGRSLFDLIELGWKPPENEVKNIATQILEILIYLQGVNPPVFHRDIKPQNIIYSEEKKVYLVDFGAVQNKFVNTLTASTIVGTYGYMSLEQLRGRANSSTDLYGLGTTLIYLLTQEHPAYLPQQNLKIQFENNLTTKISHDFIDWLNIIIEPNSQKRFTTAQVALLVLQNPELSNKYLSIQKPSYSMVRIREKSHNKLNINIPSILFSSSYSQKIIFSVIGYSSVIGYFSVIWILFFIIFNTFTIEVESFVPFILFFYFFSQQVFKIFRIIITNASTEYIGIRIFPSSTKKSLFYVILIFMSLYVFLLSPSITFSLTWLIILIDFIINEKTKNLLFYLLRSILFKECIHINKKERYNISLFNYPLFKISAINIDGKRYGHFLTEDEKHWIINEIDHYLCN